MGKKILFICGGYAPKMSRSKLRNIDKFEKIFKKIFLKN